MLSHRYVIAGRSADAHVALTDRRGGYSTAPYESLNLARHVGDEESNVAANRAALASVLGLQADRLSFTNQVHGTAVHTVKASPDTVSLTGEQAATADAQLTAAHGIGLVVLVADCTPVVLADPDAGLVATVHAGRAGMVGGVVGAAVAALHAAGARSLRAIVGPSICPRCYEVPAGLRDEVAAVEPVTASVTRSGTPALDVAAGVVAQLTRHDVAIDHWAHECTYETPGLFSYRRDGDTGRFAGVGWLAAKAG